MILRHLPALIVVLPLLAATLCAMLRRPHAAWLLALVVSLAIPPLALALLLQVLAEGHVSYWLGNWQPPWGIEYRVDAANGFLLLLVSLVGGAVMIYARDSVDREIAEDRRVWFYAMYLLCLTGQLGMTMTGDAFNVFVFMEIGSLSTYVLIAMGRDRRALVAAYQYLVLGTIGATFFVIGVGFLYLTTGTLNLADLAERLPQVADRRAIMVGLAFIVVGLSLKLALFPLHQWLPNAYGYAPSIATAFLAATATKVVIYLLLRFVFTVFGRTLPFEELALPTLLVALSLAAIGYASVTAIHKDNVKVMLAYSSVAQIGYITLGIAFGSETGLTGGIVHLFNHGMMKGALFLLVGAVAYRTGTVTVAGIAGLARRMPVTFAGIAVAGLSMIGVPGTVGFVSKWYLVMAALERGWWWLAVLVVGGSLFALVYMGRIVEAAYFRRAAAPAESIAEAPLSLLVPAWALVAGCVYFGLDTELTVEVARGAARTLLRLSP